MKMSIKGKKKKNLKGKIIISLTLILNTVNLMACGNQKTENMQIPTEIVETVMEEKTEAIENIETKEIAEIVEERKYSPEELVILVLNNGEKLEYRFGEAFEDKENNIFNYQLVTAEEKAYDANCYSYPTENGTVSQSVEDLTDLNQAWVPDYKVAVSTLKPEVFLDPSKKYTKSELASIERERNENLNAPYEYLEQEEYKAEYLFIVECNEERYIFDSRFYLRVLEETEVNGEVSARNVVYFYNPLNPKNAIKCSYGMSAEEEQKLRDEGVTSFDICIEEFTSLNKEEAESFDNKSEIRICYDITPFLTDKQKEDKKLTYQDLQALTNLLNYKYTNEQSHGMLA